MLPRLGTAMLLTLALGAAGCDDSRSAGQAQAAPTQAAPVDPTAEARRLIAEGATVIDVRTSDEWTDGHLPTAHLIPVDEIAGRVAEVEQLAGGKDRPIVVYCGTGPRAATAKKRLEAAGFTRVVNGGGYRRLRTP